MEVDLFQQGVDLMLFGMGTVFTFLISLVGAIYLMSWVISRFFPEPVQPAVAVQMAPVAVVEPRIQAVIQAAIDKHRGK
ncbi:MAG: OadG family protein [Gammaproteobacteria bacterium]|nr:OadG family protein [Gammaproteobacteria bacterium]MBQ0839900.1 OadG family protein [Gammaproteobacteria bacterium]